MKEAAAVISRVVQPAPEEDGWGSNPWHCFVSLQHYVLLPFRGGICLPSDYRTISLDLNIYLMVDFHMQHKPTPDKRDTRRGAVVLTRLGMITTSPTLVAFGPSQPSRSQAGLFRS